MKNRIILAIIFVSMSLAGMAQQWIVWSYEIAPSSVPIEYASISEFYMIGISSTFVAENGKTYYRMLFNRGFKEKGPTVKYGPMVYDKQTGLTADEITITPNKETEIGIREENGRVYVQQKEYLGLMDKDSYWKFEGSPFYNYEKTQDGELILYDFTKKTGERYGFAYGSGDIFVNRVENIQTEDGKQRKMITLSNGMKLIEGIGCINSPGGLLFYLNPQETPYDYMRLTNFRKTQTEPGSTIVNSAENIFSQPFAEDGPTAIEEVTHQKEISASSVFDIEGRRTNSHASRGIYIRDGRKVVVK